MKKKQAKAGKGGKKIIRDSNKKEIVMGVLLSDETDWREYLAADDSLDRVVETTSNSDDMLADLSDLQKRGVKIKKLVLVGHGSYSPTIGILQPTAVDKNAIRANRTSWYKDLRAMKAQLKSFNGTAKEKAEFEKKIAGYESEYQALTKREQLLDQINDVMAVDGEIEVQACKEAQYGMPLMARLAHTLLRKNGGTLRGNMDDVTLASNHFRKKVMVNLFGPAYKYKYEAKGDWITMRCPPSTQASGKKCGAPCDDFDRYGFCDNPVGQNGGTCYRH